MHSTYDLLDSIHDHQRMQGEKQQATRLLTLTFLDEKIYHSPQNINERFIFEHLNPQFDIPVYY